MSSINLSKGEKISLTKADGSALTRVKMGLGWDPAKSGGFLGFGGSERKIDLDASVVFLDDNKQVIDSVSFSNKRSRDGSTRHSGDNLTGEGEGDDETIEVDLSKVSANITKLIFTINSYSGQTFDKVERVHARLLDATNNAEMFKYNLAEKGSHTAKIMCSVYRHNGGWKASAIGAPAEGRTVGALHDAIRAVI